MDPATSLDLVRAALGGSYAHLAAKLGVSDAAISQWKKGGIPPARALEIERLTEGRVKASEIITTADMKDRGGNPTPPKTQEAA